MIMNCFQVFGAQYVLCSAVKKNAVDVKNEVDQGPFN